MDFPNKVVFPQYDSSCLENQNMITNKLDTKPVELLLDKYRVHKNPYVQEFKGLNLMIYPDVFNPAYTKVSGFLADNIIIPPNSVVLDMFCGSGALSFLAAKIAKKVIGVDISPIAIECAIQNSKKLRLVNRTEFRLADLWNGVKISEKFDLIIANPPLLPAIPENLLEMAVADSPKMILTKKFIEGCFGRLKDNARVFMSFSNACHVSFKDPLEFIKDVAGKASLEMSIKSCWDVGYETYRILEFVKI